MGIYKDLTKFFNMSLLFTANKDEDIVNMIAAEVHVGTQNCNSQMESYIYDRTRDGVFYLDLAKTWEKTMVAARIIAAIQEKNPKDVLIISSRTYAQRAVLKFATHTGANYMGGKWVPGTLTNPVIALCDSDSPLNWVDVANPANNKSRFSIAYMSWLMAREVKQLMGAIPRDQPWDVMVDLFMHRNLDAKKVDEEGEDGEEAADEEPAEADAVANTMKTFDAEGVEGDDDEEEGEDEAWGTPGAASQ